MKSWTMKVFGRGQTASIGVSRRALGMGAIGSALLLGSLALIGCPGPTFVVQQYAGPAKPQSAIATLRVNGSEPVRLLTLDEQDVAAPIESDGRLHVEVLPARHTVSVQNAEAPREFIEPVAFDAEAGKFYRVTLEGVAEAHVFEIERSSDKPVREVTLRRAGAGEGERRPRPPKSAPTPSSDAGIEAPAPADSPDASVNL